MWRWLYSVPPVPSGLSVAIPHGKILLPLGFSTALVEIIVPRLPDTSVGPTRSPSNSSPTRKVAVVMVGPTLSLSERCIKIMGQQSLRKASITEAMVGLTLSLGGRSIKYIFNYLGKKTCLEA